MLTRSSFVRALIFALIVASVVTLMPPSAHAQQTPPATPAAVTPTTQGPPPGSCIDIWAGRFDITCMWRSFMSYIGVMFIAFGIAVLDLASFCFDLLVRYIVIGFKGSLDAIGVNKGIELGWTAVRDFINIGIIGMFVFIAINIILSNKEFGQKKLIANVLVVALLLNFSLLFTRVIIDVSNFTAHQIYSSITKPNPNGTTSISEGFLYAMKVTSIAQSKATIEEIQKNAQSGWIGLLYGFTGMVLLLTVAFVLLYGCFLMAARGVLLIFLMIASPLAFATFLVPKLAESEYGLYKWWKTLLNTAIFAPLLMLSLAISLYIVQSASGSTGSTTLGQAATSRGAIAPESSWAILWVYALGIGLLFLSIRLSSSFAGKISGFNPTLSVLASPLALLGGGASLALTRGAGALAFRRAGALSTAAQSATVVAGAARGRASRLDSLAARASTRNTPLGSDRAARYSSQAGSLRSAAEKKDAEIKKLLERAAKSRETADKKVDLMGSAAGRGFNKLMGTKGVGELSKETKGYATVVREKAQAAAKSAELAKPGADQKKEMQDQAHAEATNKFAGDLENRRALHLAAEESKKAAEASRDSAKNTETTAKAQADLQKEQNASFIQTKRDLAAAKALQTDQKAAHSAEVEEMMQRIVEATDPGEKQRLREMLTQIQAGHTAELATSNARLAEAQAEHDRVVTELAQTAVGKRATEASAAATKATDAATAASKNLERAAEGVAEIEKKITAEGNRIYKAHEAGVTETIQSVAGKIGKEAGGEDVKQAARSAVKARSGKQFQFVQTMREMQKAAEEDEPSTTTPPTTTPPATT
jgi:hypothetical protein